MDSDEERLIALVGQKFVQRKDVKAYQGPTGAWYPVKDNNTGQPLPMNLGDFRGHLAGTQTLGHYMVEPDTNLCKLFAFDIDLTKPKDDFQPSYPGPESGQRLTTWTDNNGVEQIFNPRETWLWPKEAHEHPAYKHISIALRCIAESLAGRIVDMLNITTAILNSGGKGLHVYGFTGSMPAEAVRESAMTVIDSFGVFAPSRGNNFYRHVHDYDVIEIELFPKQGQVSSDGYGNLMRLPLGVNKKTGNKSYFISTRTGIDRVGIEMDPIRALEGDLPWE